MTDELLSPAEVARITTLDVTTLTKFRRNGTGPKWLPLGCRRVAYRREDVEAWLTAQTRDGAA